MTALELVQKFYPDVTSVEDAKKGVRLIVTKQDAESKAVKNHKECAMAVAAKRQMNAEAAVICVTTSYIVKGNKAYRFKNPSSVSREIVSFDRKAGFEPGDYALSVPPPSDQLGRRHEYTRVSTAKNRRHMHTTTNVRVVRDAV